MSSGGENNENVEVGHREEMEQQHIENITTDEINIDVHEEDDEDDDDDDDEDDDEDEEDDEDGYGYNSSDKIWSMIDESYAQSPLDNMLSGEHTEKTPLEDVLDEQTLIQELKSANQKVIDYLSKDSIVKRLIYHLTKEYYEEDDVDFDQVSKELNQEQSNENLSKKEFFAFKCPYIACEVVCCDSDDINEKIVSSNENIMDIFSYFIKKDASKTSMNSALSQCVIKSLSNLIQKHYSKFALAIMFKHKEDSSILDSIFVKHLYLCDMDNLVLKLLGYETTDDAFDQEFSYGGFSTQQRIRELFHLRQRGNDKELQENKARMKKWAVENNFLYLLLDKLSSDTSEDTHRNIFSIFSQIVEKGESELSETILSKEFVEKLLDVLLKNSTSTVFMIGMPFLKVILDIADPYNDGIEDKIPVAVSTIDSASDKFVEMLGDVPVPNILNSEETKPEQMHQKEDDKITLSFGTISPLGETRLRIIQHFQFMFRSNYQSIQTHLLQSGVVEKLVYLFFTYEFNSMLHCAVYNIIRTIIDGANVKMQRKLLIDAQLIKLLIAANKRNEYVLENDEKAMRLGYMGHIFEISNLLKKASMTSDSSIPKLLEKINEWTKFVEGPVTNMNIMLEKQIGGPIPMDSNFGGIYEFNNNDEDDDDDDDFIDEDSDEEVQHKNEQSDESDSDSDDETMIKHANAFAQNIEDKENDWANFEDAENQSFT